MQCNVTKGYFLNDFDILLGTILKFLMPPTNANLHTKSYNLTLPYIMDYFVFSLLLFYIHTLPHVLLLSNCLSFVCNEFQVT